MKISDPKVGMCSGYNYDTGKNFPYSYPDLSKETYTLIDVHTGQPIDSITFYGTPPNCVFTSCYVNSSLNTANCKGGGGKSGFNQDKFCKWLSSHLQ